MWSYAQDVSIVGTVLVSQIQDAEISVYFVIAAEPFLSQTEFVSFLFGRV